MKRLKNSFSISAVGSVLLVAALILAGLAFNGQPQASSLQGTAQTEATRAVRAEGTVPILAKMALEVAHEDAKQHYRDLSIYDVVIELEGSNWRVDYNLKDPTINGGGPHYLISGTDGSILMRRYEQ